MKKPKELEEYFREAVSWDADRASRARRSARVAWIGAGVAALCAIASSAALALLTPLKTVEPFVIRVDNTTGIVDVVPVYTGGSKMDEALTRYFLTHYISVCERFNFATAESDYEECSAFNSAPLNTAMLTRWAKNNPQSPLNLYRDGTTIRAQVTSISFFERANGASDLVQVRYVKNKRSISTNQDEPSHWIATIQYAYAKPSMDPRLRRWNPLGFKIAEFRSEPEMVETPVQDQANVSDKGTTS